MAEGRLSAGFTVNSNDRRVYVSGDLIASSTSIPSVTSFTDGKYYLGASTASQALSPANEIFEAIFYHTSLTDAQMVNLTSNMTYFFNKRGSIPLLTTFAAYSVRRINATYGGPQLQIQRSSDSLLAELFLDELSNFTLIRESVSSQQITDYIQIISWL